VGAFFVAAFRKNQNLAGTLWARLEINSKKRICFQDWPFSNLTSSAKKNFTTEPILIFTPG